MNRTGSTPEDRSVVFPHEVGRSGKCMHFGTYVVDQALAEVECGTCGAKLNPMWVLRNLACDDARMNQAAERYQDELKRLAERKRTKCQHCGQMTRISSRR